MSKTSAAVKARYNKKAYDIVTLFIPKGRKQDILDRLNGESLNGYFSKLAMKDMGLTEEQWKQTKEEDSL